MVPELTTVPDALTEMPVPPLPTAMLPLWVMVPPLLTMIPVAPVPPMMVPELLIVLLLLAAMPNAEAPTVTVPRLVTTLLLFSDRPVPTAAFGCTFTVRPFCEPALKPPGEAPAQVTMLPSRTQAARLVDGIRETRKANRKSGSSRTAARVTYGVTKPPTNHSPCRYLAVGAAGRQAQPPDAVVVNRDKCAGRDRAATAARDDAGARARDGRRIRCARGRSRDC